MSEFKHCSKCKDGYIYKIDNSGFFRVAIECDCHKKWVAENQLEKKYKHNGFDMRNFNYNPRSYVGKKSAKDKDRLINYVNQFELNPDVRKIIVYIYGPNGTQKSTLVSWVGKTLLSKGFSVRYYLMKDLINILLNAESFNEELKESSLAILEKLNNTDLIIIDESFDKSKTWISRSGYELGTLDSWIRKRISSLNKGIIFVSNINPKDIVSQNYSVSISDFINREITINDSLLKFEDNYIQSSIVEFSGSLF